MQETPPLRLTSSFAEYDLKNLVDHDDLVGGGQSVEVVYQHFQKSSHEFLGVCDNGLFIGMVSRGQIGFLLGGRYGFAIYSRVPVREHLLTPFLQVKTGTPLLEVFDLSLSRTGNHFYDDVALVDGEGHYAGMISVERLVRLQSELIAEQAGIAMAQRRELEEKNNQLFRSLNELRQSRGRYEILFENSALGVALLNARGEVETANSRLTCLLSALDNAGETRLNLASLVGPADEAAFRKLLASHETGAGPGSRTAEFTLHLPGRGPRLFKFFTNWIPETGQICALLDDITEQRVFEKRLAQKERSAMLETLVGGIAHEINNKLSPIVGFAGLLVEQVRQLHDSKDLARYCLTIRDSALESAKIIRQLLQLSRPHNIELRPCDLRMLAQEAADFLQFRIRETNCSLLKEFPVDPTPVLVDQAQIKQVVMNLILNALDAMDGRPVRELSVRIVATGEQTRLFVKDTGQGISPEHLARIFDPFFTTKTPDRGTGLGLSVCYSILQQHGGEIAVESVAGKGSTFMITLRTASGGASATKPPEATESSAASGTTEFLRRARVLIVDDEDYITGLIQETLRLKLNCIVDQAGDGREAILRLGEAGYDLVISDVRMPGLDGFGVFDWVQKNRPHLVRRFLFITGDAGSADLNQRLESLGAPVLRKPFDVEALTIVCRRLLKSRPGEPSDPGSTPC